MNKTSLHLVAKPPIPMPFDDERGKKRMLAIKAQLLAAAVRYVKDGKDGTRGDRLRAASSASGIPLNLIDVEAGR